MMKLRITKYSGNLALDSEWPVLAISVFAHSNPLFVFMVWDGYGLTALRRDRVEVVDKSMEHFDYLTWSHNPDGGLFLHKMFEAKTDVYEKLLEFDSVTLDYIRVKMDKFY